MPTVSIEARLIRVTADLLVEKGHYLLIYQDDRIIQLTPDEARKLAAGIPEARKVVNHRARGPNTMVDGAKYGANGTSRIIQVDGKTIRLGKTTYEVLHMLLAATRDNQIWVRTRSLDHHSASARLVDLRKMGFTVSKNDGEAQLLWQLTNNGLALLRAAERQNATT